MRLCMLIVLFLTILSCVKAQFKVPQVHVEVLQPKGFRVSIPGIFRHGTWAKCPNFSYFYMLAIDEPGISLFAFHGKINEELENREAGHFSVDVIKAKNGRWTYNNRNAILKPTDVLYYWVNVDYDDGNGKRGYILDDQEFKVSEGDSVLPPIESCVTSASVYDGGKTTCSGNLIFEDKFENNFVDTNKWIIEHKIPSFSEPNFEFNTYENRKNTCFVQNNILYLQPIIALQDDESVRGTLDLRQGCTSNLPLECLYARIGAHILPPVKSAKIKSKISFKYGKVEIRAKLPTGDWIIPVMRLQSKFDDTGNKQIWIAYSRGNNHLIGNGGDDLGSQLLFAGPVSEAIEPERSRRLVSKGSNVPFSSDFHTYSMEWTRERLKFYLDSEEYGNVNVLNFPLENKEYVVSLGVLVGGLNDFPDGYNSGSVRKPWSNLEPIYIKNFFESRDQWSTTWRGGDSALQVDYVKIWAI